MRRARFDLSARNCGLAWGRRRVGLGSGYERASSSIVTFTMKIGGTGVVPS